eukprot:7389844-Prymnesium_polylepis.1
MANVALQSVVCGEKAQLAVVSEPACPYELRLQSEQQPYSGRRKVRCPLRAAPHGSLAEDATSSGTPLGLHFRGRSSP